MNVTNIIRGVVNATKYTVTAPIIKEDYGLYLKIEGLDLPAVYEVDFSNSESSGSSVTMVGNADGVLIPRQFIKSGQDVFAFLYWTGEDFGRTVYKFRIPNKLRPDRTSEQPTPEEQSLIDQAISALNSAVEQTAADVETTTAKAAEATSAAATATQKASEAAASATAAGTYATRAETALHGAETARTASQQSAAASATSAEQAAGSALTASTKAGEASASATAAAQSASSASQSAISARDYKDAANLSAESASEYAGAASQSATTAGEQALIATQKASESAQSALDASTAKDDAVTAKNAAETARTGAETAQGLAEDAREGAETAQAAAEAAVYAKAPIIEDTATGAVASFPDGADNFPMESLKVAIDPVQDLHGYENPWPAGGGKNKLPSIDSTKTINGVTWTLNDDGRIGLTGTASANSVYDFGRDSVVLAAGTYTTLDQTVSGSYTVTVFKVVDGSASVVKLGGGVFTLTDSASVFVRYSVVSGTTVNTTISPQIEEGSTATAYAPYSNICPITGWTGAQVVRTGKNLFDEVCEKGSINPSTGADVANNGLYRSKNYIRVEPNTTYYILNSAHAVTNNASIRLCFYDKNKTFIESPVGYALSRSFTTPNNAYYVRFFVNDNMAYYASDISVNYPSTDHDYHAYTGQSVNVSWETEAGTVYGGTLDVVSGELVVDRASVDLGTLSLAKTGGRAFYAIVPYMVKKISPNLICSLYAYDGGAGTGTITKDKVICYDWNFLGRVIIFDTSQDYTDAATFKAAMSGVQLVYELAEPITYHLTPTEVRTLLGQNNVWADTGDSTVEYVADTKRYIDKKIAEIVN